MSRNWDTMRNATYGPDPRNRMRERERGSGGARWFEGVPDYGQGLYGAYRNEPHERQDYPRQGPRYGGYGYERGESEAMGGGYEHHERGGLLGHLEESVDRAFGNDWERGERYRGMRNMRGDMRDDRNYGDYRDHDHPSFWERVKGAFTGGTFSGRGPKNWARSDERIREDVCECLTYHPNIDASEIEVVVKEGEVTLTGMVEGRGSKRLAEDIVEDVRGVRDVHNQLRIQRQNVQGTTGPSAQTAGTPSTTGAMPTNQAWNQARR